MDRTPLTPTPVQGQWYLVDIDGQPYPALCPAYSPDQARTTVQAEIIRSGYPGTAVGQAHIATEDGKAQWIKRIEHQRTNRDLPNPTDWQNHVYNLVRTDKPTPINPTDERPITSRAPNIHQETALQATAHRLINLAQPLLFATLLLTTLTAIGITLLAFPQYWMPLLAVAALSTLFTAVWVAQWLDRLDTPTTVDGMKWCPQHGRVPTNHTHPKRRRQRNHQDENQRRQILEDHKATIGEWCEGDTHCIPTGHPSSDLTVDHLWPQSKGGTLHDGYRIICRKANSARGNRPIGAG